MRAQRLTQLTVDRLKLAPGERVEIPDGTVPGLALRASWGGTRTYALRFRHGGRQYRHVLGKHPAMSLGDARKAARALLAQLDMGVNPLAPAKPRGTVRSVYEDWLRRDQADNRTIGETRRIFAKEILPAWGERPIESVRRRDVIELVDGIRDRGAPIAANRTLSRVRRMFAWAAGRDLIESNPAQYVEKAPECARDRVLDDAELATVWRACAGLGVFGAGVRLLLLTAARKSELFEATWGEIRLDGPEPAIVLPAERSKVAEGRAIPLSPLAVEIISALPRRPAHEFVVSLTGATPLGSVGKLKRQLDARLAGMSPWVLHDLRRSAATGLQRLGIQLQVIEAVLGHVSGSRAGIVGTYQRHAYATEARAALDAWGVHVAGLARLFPKDPEE